MLLVYFLGYRLDLVLFGAVVLGIVWFARRVTRERAVGFTPPIAVRSAVVIIAVIGAGLAEWSGRQQRATLANTFAGFGPTYAHEFSTLGHSRISLETPADDPLYLQLIERERAWLRLNPLIADIYTFRRDAEGRVRLLVDSETDYDRNGRIEGDREQRTKIGEIYAEATPKFFAALEGAAVFDTSFVPDRWGVWVSSLSPIYGPDGKVEAALGIDYPAGHWLAAIAAKRGLVLITTAFLIGLLASSATWVMLLRAEIGERREAERKLAVAKEAADAANRAKGTFLAVMSHEIRTPLTAVVGYGSMLRETPLDATQQRYLRTMYQGASTLLDLLNNVLDHSKLEEGQLELECVDSRPAELVGEVLDLMRCRAEAKGIALEFADGLEPGAMVATDPTRIRQVLINLVGNAIKFTERGGVTVRTRWQGAARPDARRDLEISVVDTGPGIPPDKLPRLFQMFVQADASTARRYGGTGLGLAICRRLADLLGGEISAQSEPGRGATFTFVIPVEVRLAGPPAPPVAFEPAPAPDHVGPAKLLVVDDNPINREVMHALLTPLGYSVELAEHGPAAIELVRAHRYDAILLDLHMPEMDGFAVARTIRREEAGRVRTPIIAVTAHAEEDVRSSCFSAGMDDFVPKPVERSRLLTALQRLCSPIAT